MSPLARRRGVRRRNEPPNRFGIVVNNLGPEDLFLRLLFEELPAAPGPPTNLALTADVVHVPAGSGWRTVEFAITPLDLVALAGTASGALMNTDVLRIFHNPRADFPGPPQGPPPVSAQLGVDNILAVPEPRALSLLGVALVGLLLASRPDGLARSRRQRRRRAG